MTNNYAQPWDPRPQMRIAIPVAGRSIQPPRPRLRGVVLGLERDRAGVVMDHPPGAADAPEPVRRRERRGADDLDAQHPSLVARDHRGGIIKFDSLHGALSKDVPPGF